MSVLCTVVCGVLPDTDVEEGGVEPAQCHADISDGMQDYLCIEMLYQVVVKAAGEHSSKNDNQSTIVALRID